MALIDDQPFVPTPRVHGQHPAPSATLPPLPWKPCAHLGPPTGEEKKCELCGGGMVPLSVCRLHGTCTTDRRLVYREGGYTHEVKWCRTCNDHTGKPLTLNLGAGGLGDALLASAAVAAVVRREPNRNVRYRISSGWIPFLSLFDGGWYDLQPHDWDDCANEPKNARPGDVQVNYGYNREQVLRFREKSRLERYCHNVGGVEPVRPKLKFPDMVSAACRPEWAGIVALAPFSTFPSREWPILHWRTLERMLVEAGYRVLTLDANCNDRHRAMRGEKLINAPAVEVTGTVLRAACLVSNDSGLAHLGGILGTPTVVIHGQIPHARVYGWYGPHIVGLEGHLDCRGCCWQNSAGFSAEKCQPVCPNLASNSPADVFRKVVEMAGPPTSAGGETVKAHARRVREGWYEAHVRPPLLDIGCGRDPILPGFPCQRWDTILGDDDAQLMRGMTPENYYTIYASHVLEHVVDPEAALRRWYELLAPGGKLIVCVPHMDLYEHKVDLPSRGNGDHKTYWVEEAPPPGYPPHVRGLRQSVLRAIPGADIISLRRLDEGYAWEEKTWVASGEFSIEAIIKKPE